jgi:hypothetical protein
LIGALDTLAQFYVAEKGDSLELERKLTTLQSGWDKSDQRADYIDSEWVTGLSAHLDSMVEMRVEHVREWITSNLSRFAGKTSHANIEALHRAFDSAAFDLRASVQLCKFKCASCHLLCLKPKGHSIDENHDCQTKHECRKLCDYGEDHNEEEKCGYS